MALTQVQGGMLQGSTNTTTTIQSNGTTAITIDSSQNVGVGTTPSAWSSSSNAIQNNGGALWQFASSNFYIGQNYYFNGTNRIYTTTAEATEYQQGAGLHRWFTAPSGTAGTTATFTERMRIDSSGNLLVNGTTVYAKQTVANNTSYNYASLSVGNNADHMIFKSDSTTTGSINRVGGTGVIYNTTSDYRLKENVAPITDALAKVAQLKPCTYTWKLDGSSGQGFIAHELQEVIPDAVSGEKDAVDENGDIKPQGIDQSRIVATLTAAIQELKAELDATKAEVAALKAAP